MKITVTRKYFHIAICYMTIAVIEMTGHNELFLPHFLGEVVAAHRWHIYSNAWPTLTLRTLQIQLRLKKKNIKKELKKKERGVVVREENEKVYGT